jgi:hypothetical protein
MMNDLSLHETLVADRRRHHETKARFWRLSRLTRGVASPQRDGPAAHAEVIVLPQRSRDDRIAA